MPDTYTQTYTCHVHDVQCMLKNETKETIDKLIKCIPALEEYRVDLIDHLSLLRTRCFEESFSLGIELGLRIAWEFSGK